MSGQVALSNRLTYIAVLNLEPAPLIVMNGLLAQITASQNARYCHFVSLLTPGLHLGFDSHPFGKPRGYQHPLHDRFR